MERKKYDFLSGILLAFLGIAVVWESYRMWLDVGGEFVESPGLMPAVLGGLLIIAALVLASQSFQEAGGRAVFANLKNGFMSLFGKNRRFAKDFSIVLIAVGFFTFILLPNLPFWLSSFIFMVYTMFLAGARKLWLVLVSAAGVSAVIQLIFEKIFRVPLPSSHEADVFLSPFYAFLKSLF